MCVRTEVRMRNSSENGTMGSSLLIPNQINERTQIENLFVRNNKQTTQYMTSCRRTGAIKTRHLCLFTMSTKQICLAGQMHEHTQTTQDSFNIISSGRLRRWAVDCHRRACFIGSLYNERYTYMCMSLADSASHYNQHTHGNDK